MNMKIFNGMIPDDKLKEASGIHKIQAVTFGPFS